MEFKLNAQSKEAYLERRTSHLQKAFILQFLFLLISSTNFGKWFKEATKNTTLMKLTERLVSTKIK